MKTKKPDIFLGITMCMLVLAAVLCIVILFVQKNSKEPAKPSNPDISISSNTNTPATGEGSDTNPGSTDETGKTPEPSGPSTELADIDASGLQAKLDDALKGLSSEWQVMVIDPAKGTRISSAVNCKVDDWMTANRMAQVFIMGTVFQQIADGTLQEGDVMADVKAMMSQGDSYAYAADRLIETLGGGDAAKGRDAVKAFAVANDLQLGFNRNFNGSSSKKNYVSAQKTAGLLDLICQGKLVSPDASAQMLELLLSSNASPEIAPGLVTEGARSGFVCDVEEGTCICSMGVVKLPNRSFVISVVCNEPNTTQGAKDKITEIIALTETFFAK